MNSRPLLIILTSCLFIAAGTIGIIYHASELKNIPTVPEEGWILLVRLLAILGGIFILRRANWARWLLTVWIVYHVILSFFHTTSELIMHIVVMIVVVVALFNPKSNAYFKKNSDQ